MKELADRILYLHVDTLVGSSLAKLFCRESVKRVLLRLSVFYYLVYLLPLAYGAHVRAPPRAAATLVEVQHARAEYADALRLTCSSRLASSALMLAAIHAEASARL